MISEPQELQKFVIKLKENRTIDSGAWDNTPALCPSPASLASEGPYMDKGLQGVARQRRGPG